MFLLIITVSTSLLMLCLHKYSLIILQMGYIGQNIFYFENPVIIMSLHKYHFYNTLFPQHLISNVTLLLSQDK